MPSISRRLVVAGTTLALALPAPALAHKGHHRHHHGFGVPCRALEAGKTPRGLSADQAAALKDACTARDNAIKAANDTFKASTADALAAYKTAVAPARANVKSAWQSLRTACKADWRSQECSDARSAYRTALDNARPVFRDAWKAYFTATQPARDARSAAIRDAQKAFKAAVAKVFA
jgi:hypothetical protein